MNDDQVKQEIQLEAHKRANEHVSRIRLLRIITLFLWPAVSTLMFISNPEIGWIGLITFVLVGLLIITILDGLIYPLILVLAPFVYFIPMRLFDLLSGKDTMSVGVPRNLVNGTTFILYLAYVIISCYFSYLIVF